VSADGQLTLGQLARENYGDESRLLGFTHVHRNGDRGQRVGRDRGAQKSSSRGLPNSVEELMHETDKKSFYVPMRVDDRVSAEPWTMCGWDGANRGDLPSRDRTAEPLLPVSGRPSSLTR